MHSFFIEIKIDEHKNYETWLCQQLYTHFFGEFGLFINS